MISGAEVNPAVNVQSELSQVVAGGLRIEISVRRAMTTIALRGEWDLAAQREIRRAIDDALADPPERLVLDLSGLSFTDASGLHGAIELARRATAMNVPLAIVPGPRAVQRVFEVCQVNELPWVDE